MVERRFVSGRAAVLGAAGIVALCGAVIAGCGGSGASSTPDFTARANAICADADRHIESIPTSGTSLSDLAGQAEEETPVLRGENESLAALTPPSGERSEFAAALKSTTQELAVINKLIVAVRAENSEQILTLGLRGEQLTAAVKAEMTGLGLSACALSVVPGGGSGG